MGEFGVSDKEPNKNSITTAAATTRTSVRKVQQEALITRSERMNMMMVHLHHNHHHRPLSQPFDGDGPTIPQYTSLTNHHHNINPAAVTSAPLGAIDAAAAAVRPLQPFHISPYTCSSATTTTSPSSSAFISSGMAASSLGFFPFTSAQWKELERQAMIYKYMMASVPVPPDLLMPIASRSPLVDGGFNLRLSSSSGNSDPEPGRCRRTDGKKWRCSRDVAPNHKYCERHMHRGRPRSRKPVEVHTNNTTTINNNGQQQMKRARHGCDPFANSGVTVAISNPTTTRKDGPSPRFLASHAAQPYLESSLSLDNFAVKGASFGSVASSKEPRGLDWMLNGDPISLGASDSEWHSLMHNNKVGLNAMNSCSDTESHYLNSFALYGSALDQDQHNRRPPIFLNPLVVPMEERLQSEKPRGFIDAWGAEENNADNKNNVSTIGKLSLSSLDLSMGSGYMHEDHMGGNEMGLCLMEHDGNNNTHNHHSDIKGNNLSNWLTPSSTPGGPLAEVLRPSTVTASSNSNPSSPAMTANAESNSRTMVSSPSGVLHKTLASLSDSSGNSSPTVASSSGANSEIALLRFNHKSN